MPTTKLDIVHWRLWNGPHLVLEVRDQPADTFHVVEFIGTGWPLEQRYRAFRLYPDADPPILDAQLEKEGNRFFG